MRQVRRALRDNAARPKFIETLPKRGYRFIATVSACADRLRASSTVDRRIHLGDKLVEGRRLLREMGVDALDRAKRVYEEALDINLECAMAHSGLGATYAMRVISRCEPGDLRLARAELEHAIALDPELAEPYPWLCYV